MEAATCWAASATGSSSACRTTPAAARSCCRGRSAPSPRPATPSSPCTSSVSSIDQPVHVSAALLLPIDQVFMDACVLSCRREGEEEAAAEGQRLRHLHARRIRRSLWGQAGEIEFFFIRLCRFLVHVFVCLMNSIQVMSDFSSKYTSIFLCLECILFVPVWFPFPSSVITDHSTVQRELGSQVCA